MAGEWVTAISTIGGGVVGVAGTLGATWLTQRREERADERERRYQVVDRRRAERREAYVGLLDGLTTLDRAAKLAGYAASLHDNDLGAKTVAVTDAYQDLMRRLHDVEIDGSDEVGDCAKAAVLDAARVVDEVLRDATDVRLINDDLKSALVAAVRRDLGVAN